MKMYQITGLTLLLIASAGVATADGKKTIEPIDLGKIETRTEILKNGRSLLVPKDAVMVPGHPIMFTEDDLNGFRETKKSLDTLGYVNAPGNSLPMADETLRMARKRQPPAALGPTNREKELAEGNFLRVRDVNVEAMGLAKVNPSYLNKDSEGYVSAGRSEAVRVYSNTKLGNIFIHEIVGAKMKTLNPDPTYGVQFGTAHGYASNIRYDNGQMITLYALSTDTGVLTIALEANNALTYEFITDLVSR